MADKNKQGDYYTRPQQLGKWEGFKKFLWDGETSEFLGRTAGSWVKILLFYVIFYAVLAGFFAALLLVFFETLDDNTPKWQLTNGLIGDNPGLGFRPMPEESNVESTLVWFEANDRNTRYWTDEIETFLGPYKKQENDDNKDNRMICDHDNPPVNGKVCFFDMSKLSVCNSSNKFNYPIGKPCIFLKLNKIFNWLPKYYEASPDPKNLPAKMPDYIKEKINMMRPGNKSSEIVWVSCEGENPADMENIGARNYYPDPGFPGYFFPFQNQRGYLPPLIAVSFENPNRGVLINIECKAWAHNIFHDRAERRGSVHFELMID